MCDPPDNAIYGLYTLNGSLVDQEPTFFTHQTLTVVGDTLTVSEQAAGIPLLEDIKISTTTIASPDQPTVYLGASTSTG